MIIQFFTSLFHRLSATLAESSAISAWRFVPSLKTKTTQMAVLLLLTTGLTQAQDRPFITTWKTTWPNQTIQIPWNWDTYSLDYTVDWGDGTIDTHVANNASHTYAQTGVYEVQISGFFDAIYMPSGSSSSLLSIEQWGDIEWRTMSYAFAGATNLQINATDAPDLSAVTDMSGMFQGATSLDADLSTWDVSQVTNMSSMFSGASSFDQNLGNWDISNVTNMSDMLYNTSLSISNYDQTLAGWAYLDADAGETKIPTYISFFNAKGLTTCDPTSRSILIDTYHWNIYDDKVLAGGIIPTLESLPAIVSKHAVQSLIPPTATDCNGTPITATTDATLPITDIQTVTWTYISASGGISTQEQKVWVGSPFTTTWETANDIDAQNFIKVPINSGFNYSYIVDWGDGSTDNTLYTNTKAPIHEYALAGTYTVSIYGQFPVFYGPGITDRTKLLSIDQWGDIEWETMNRAFSNMTNMTYQATDAPDLSQVTDLSNMFSNTKVFDADLSGWDVSNITNMSYMFSYASAFNQNLGSWNISNVTNMYGMLDNTLLSSSNYDQTLTGWSFLDTDAGEAKVPRWVSLGSSGLIYCDTDSHSSLTSSFSWNITGDKAAEAGIIPDSKTLDPVISKEPLSSLTPPMAMSCEGGIITATTDAVFPINSPQTITWTYTHDEGGTTTQEQEVWAGRPFVMKWQTMDSYSGKSNVIQIPLNPYSSLDYSYIVDWGDGIVDPTVYTKGTMPLHEYTSSGTYTISIYGYFPAAYQGYLYDRSKFLSIEQWGDIEWKTMASAFADLPNMVCNATDLPNLTQVTDLSYMFSNAKSFNSDLSHWDVSNITNMSSTFSNASAFNQNLGNWDISKVNYMSNMLNGTALSVSNYDQTLAGWATLDTEAGETNIPINMSLGANELVYCDGTSRSLLADVKYWTISGDETAEGGIVPDSKTLTSIFSTESLESLVPPTATSCSGEVITATTDAVFPIDAPQTVIWTYTSQEGGINTQSQYVFVGEPFVTTWQTLSGEGYSNFVYIPIITWNGNTYSFKVDWGDGSEDDTIYTSESFPIHEYETEGSYSVSIFGQFPAISAGNGPGADLLLSIDQWGDIEWKSMNYAFGGASNMIYKATDTPNLSNVTSMSEMFYKASSFNHNLGNWDISNIEDMDGMLDGTNLSAENYALTLAGWATLSGDETQIPEDIYLGADGLIYCDDTDRIILIETYNWEIEGDAAAEGGIVPDVRALSALVGNDGGTIESLVAPTATTCTGETITATTDVLLPITSSQTIAWTYTSTTGATATQNQYAYVGKPFVTTWETMSDYGKTNAIYIPINSWDDYTYSFSVDWGDGSSDNTIYTEDSNPVHEYETTGQYTVSIYGQFPAIYADNWDGRRLLSIDQWGDIEWETMEEAFAYAENMVYKATDVPDLSKVTSMSEMFYYALSFDGDLSSWDVSQVEDMYSMLYRASSFDHNLASWDISSVTDMDRMLSRSGLSLQNYSLTLAGWATLDTEAGEIKIPTGIELGSDELYYCDETYRNLLIDTYSWDIYDDEQNCPPTISEVLEDIVGACSVDMPATLPTAYDEENNEIITGVTNAAFPIYANTEITWIFTDREGNSSTQTQQVIITDDTAPAPDMATLPTLSSQCDPITSLLAPTATDLCSGSITGTTDIVLPITESTMVTWTFTDAAGNQTTQTQTVTIEDTTAPVANVASLETITGECTIAANAITVPLATDNCNGEIIATTETVFPITATTTVTWVYTDGLGNQSSQTQEVIIECATLGVDETFASVEIYPNPASASFSLSSQEEANTVIIMDVSGHTVKQFTQSQHNYDIRELPVGIYLVEFYLSGTKQVRRLIKQ
ncbi:BspA family leucine-rich repeat surface protein [Reichenbachiella agarivorans]|uniref:BspA family leucine-rich repeat surface protein n=1 Tax=Reichenbachiella agarivorans TaxID=2979464 RepID=A0ABY6CSA6_9BACT|nr:BspA family leucine-rich repeat surface protein [Reichenbachiella agarivorans]UXP33376.1 BspA family leucine-rich repeat surface protein [Reichenbachiella agarivorans]